MIKREKEKMLKTSEIGFIQESFRYALDRMKDLPNEIWGDYIKKQNKILETEKKQREILEKLRKEIEEEGNS